MIIERFISYRENYLENIIKNFIANGDGDLSYDWIIILLLELFIVDIIKLLM